ncbi:MAG: hypothetical protein ACM3U2_13385, partial [Deltaproteobacteria bacterium]
GELLRQVNSTEEAEIALRKSVAAWEKLTAERDHRDHSWHLITAYGRLVKLLREANRADEAEAVCLNASALWEERAREHSDSADYRAYVALVCNNLAWNLVASGEPDARISNAAVGLARNAVELAPNAAHFVNTLGVAYYRAAQWNAAIETLTRSEELYRGDNFSHNALFIAMAHWQRGDKDQARKAYAAALVWIEKFAPRNDELLRFRAEAASLLGLPEQLSADQDQAKSDDLKYATLVLDARPETAWAYFQRARIHATRGEVTQADADFAKAIELDPDDVVSRYWHALAHVAAGDLAGYQTACAAMLERFGQSDKPEVGQWVAWTGALVPGAVKDPRRLVKMAEMACASDPRNSSFTNSLGAALYRAGRFDEAIGRLNDVSTAWEQAAAKPPMYSPAYPWFFLAMAHHRLGHAEEGRQWIDKAVQRMDEEMRNENLPWTRRATLQLFRGEAEALLKTEGRR